MAGNKLLPGGFPEQSIVSQKRENIIKDLVRKNFETYAFVNIETPAVEAVDVLVAKGGEEVSKQIFGLYGLAQGSEDLKRYALHFDLTVPLARYVIDHEHELKFPFKRSQLQKVWRGERQQKGRFKEFYQCDVDIVDTQLHDYYDAEVIEVLYKTLQKIFAAVAVQKDFVVKLNNRNLYAMLFAAYDISGDLAKEVLATIDAYYKFSSEKDFQAALEKLLGERTTAFLKNIALLCQCFETGDETLLDEKYKEYVSQTMYILDVLKKNGVHVVFDPYIVRGLDYYDGTVFETYMVGHESIGSICSGGRYSNLVGALRERTGKKGVNYAGVGGSIGLSRLLYVMEQEGRLEKNFALADVMIFNIDKEESSESLRHNIAHILREKNIRVDHYIAGDKLGKQFNYAEAKSIEFGIFIEESYYQDQKIKLKNLETRTETYVTIDELPDLFS